MYTREITHNKNCLKTIGLVQSGKLPVKFTYQLVPVTSTQEFSALTVFRVK
jgi:hypothetical protein